MEPAALKAVFEQAAIGIVLFDIELRYRQINPVAAAMTGNTPEQLVGRTLEEVVREHFGADKAAESVGCFRRVLETGQRVSLRGWSGLVAGKRYSSDWEVDRIEGERGEVLGVLLTVTDVTERALAEQSLHDREERLRAIITTAVDGIITIDEQGLVESLNPAAERLFGYPAPEVIGRNIKMLMPSPYHEEHDQYLTNYLRTGQKKIIGIGREVVGRCKDGTTFPMYLAVSELHVSGRRMFTGLVHDLTAQKRAEADLKQAKEAAEAANQAKDQFLAIVSHELRTPLNAILGWVQLLKRGLLSEAERIEAIEKIEQSAHAQTRLIEDILDATRAVTGKLRMQMRPVPLVPAIQAAIDAVRPSAEAKGIDIQTHYADASATVMGDASRLQQVFSNLLTNSIKFSTPGQRIEVHLDPLGPSIRVRIVDQGEGINPEFLPHLFERFSQDATGQRHGGLGLGLSIVKHIVELHGGSITAESAGRGQGAAFMVSLPSRPPVR